MIHPMVKPRKAACFGCRGYRSGFRDGCDLGYATKLLPAVLGIQMDAPAEPCPRPVTLKQYFAAPKRRELGEQSPPVG